MDNNVDMNLLLRKAQEMVNNNQIPPELKNVVNNISSQQANKEIPSNTTAYSNSSVGSNISSSDLEKMSELLKKMKDQSGNDDLSQLLYALKPYLRNQKQEKIDSYVKLIKMGKMAQFLDIFGGENK